jgi:hypothetical protein
MLPDEDEPTLPTIMLKYSLLKARLDEIRSSFPYQYVKRPGGTALLYSPLYDQHLVCR